jgi:hypothetical protein
MKLLFSVAALLVMTAGLARAQQIRVERGSTGSPPGSPGTVRSLILREEVRKDLGLSDEVANNLRSLNDDSRAALQKGYQDAGINRQDIPNLPAEQRRKSLDIGQKIDDEFSAKAKELLTADQNKRLQQIQLQYRLNLGMPMGLLAPEVAADLKLTNDQRQALQTLRGEFTRSLLPLGGGNHREAVEKNRQNQELAITNAIDVLTAEQKETLDKLKVNAFDFSNISISVRAGPAKAQPQNERTVETGSLNPDII